MLVRGPDNVLQRLRIFISQVWVTAQVGGDHGHRFRLAPLLAIKSVQAIAQVRARRRERQAHAHAAFQAHTAALEAERGELAGAVTRFVMRS